LGSCSSDDDFGAHRRNPHLYAGVTVLRQLSRQNLIQFREKHSISHELQRIYTNILIIDFIIGKGLVADVVKGYCKFVKIKELETHLSLLAHLSRHCQ